MHHADIPTCPAWASDIFAVRKEKRILVHGFSRWAFGYPCPRELRPGDDLLAEYWNYALGRETQPLHLVLAGATDDGQLEEFVRGFGPLGGRVERVRSQSATEEEVVVSESWLDLRHKQKLFRNLFQLVSVLREKKPSTRVAAQIAECAKAIRGFEPHSPRFAHELELLAFEITDAALAGDWRTVYTKGHDAVCHVFALFPTRMIPYSDGAVDLPNRKRTSVLAEAIFMLKKDYESGWLLSFCKNPSCQTPFRASRKDKTCCGEECSGQVRYRRYYRRKGYKKRRKRYADAKAAAKSPIKPHRVSPPRHLRTA